ncbi:MAG: CvpA family protein [Pseudomonadales bacterium]
MAGLDIALMVVIGASALMGLMRGLLKEVLSVATWILAFVLALGYGPAFAAWFPLTADAVAGTGVITGQIKSDTVSLVIGFAAVFVLTLICGSLIRWLLDKLVDSTGLTGLDRLLGLLFGAVRGIVISVVLLIAVRPFAQETQWWQGAQLRDQLMTLEDDVLHLWGAGRRFIMELSD